MGKVTVEIDTKTGEVVIRGEALDTAALKKSLEGIGKVTERHVGHAKGSTHTHSDGSVHTH